MRPGLRLAARDALGGRFDAVHDGVAQHVLERRQHALEHLPVELAEAPVTTARPLAGLGGDLAHDARQPLHVRWNGTMRVRIRPFCRSVTTRACCISRFCASRVRFSSRP
jgi:hypothetical protein